MSTTEDLKWERKERERRIDLIRDDFVNSAVLGLINLDGLLSDLQRELEYRLGYWGFNIATQDEREMEESVKLLMEMTNDCCLTDEQIVSFLTMEPDERCEWAAERISLLRYWNGSGIGT
jgi:hypothetical protein